MGEVIELLKGAYDVVWSALLRTSLKTNIVQKHCVDQSESYTLYSLNPRREKTIYQRKT